MQDSSVLTAKTGAWSLIVLILTTETAVLALGGIPLSRTSINISRWISIVELAFTNTDGSSSVLKYNTQARISLNALVAISHAISVSLFLTNDMVLPEKCGII
jgi:hypothetical protein